jgi:Flp pilus assembly pilin Flp
MFQLLRNLQINEQAQGLVEYALLIGVIALVVAVAMMLIAPEIGGAFSEVGSQMS